MEGRDALLEREQELGLLEGAVRRAAEGDGALALIEGPAGVGKTALLGATRARAERQGVRVLAARGGVLERDYPFGIVRQLVEPALERSKREAILSRAGEQSALGEASWAALEELRRAVAGLASEQPLLIAVDDAHWGDPGSLRFLAHLAGRLEDAPAAVVVAYRSREPDAPHDLLSALATDPAATVLRPAELTPEAVEELLAEVAESRAAELAMAAHRATAGNPFLVDELVRTVGTNGFAPGGPAAERIAWLASEGVAEAVVSRLAPLGRPASQVARALSVLGGSAELRTVAALAELDEPAARSAADALVDADILLPTRPLEFHHALVRTAIYKRLSASERESAHSRAARVLAAADSADVEGVAAHLLETEPRSERWTIDWLLRAAERAMRWAACEEAVDYLRRARAEPPPAELRARVCTALGEAEGLAGLARESVDTLADALAASDDPVERAGISRRLGQALLRVQRGAQAVDVLAEAIAGLPASELELGLQLEAEMRLSAVVNPDAARMARGRRPRFEAEPEEPRTRGERVALAVRALDEAFTGSAERAAELSLRALGDGTMLALDGGESPTFGMAAGIVFYAGRLEASERAFSAALSNAEERGSVFGIAFSRSCRANTRQRRGMLAAAQDDARAALEVHRLGMQFATKAGLGALVAALVEQGRLADAQAALEDLDYDGPLPDALTAAFIQCARARLRLEQRDFERALADELELDRRHAEHGVRNPNVICWPASPAPALAALGREDEARERAARGVDAARRFGSARELGIALLVAGELDGDLERLAESAEALESAEDRLAHARALVTLGAARRRAGDRRAAREPLREGLAYARHCGATPLVERAHDELAAAGARPRKILRAGVEELTPSERRVAGLAARGLPNKQIARELVVSPRTVETHLAHAYRKLEISSRDELASVLADEGSGVA